MPTTTPNLPNRTFGVEIEAVGITRADAVQALRDAGLVAMMENYNHRTRPHWKVTTDSSVDPGFEVVSPVLRGENGVTQLRTAVRALAQAGARVDRRCGLHVHIGVEDLTANELAACIVRYSRFEREIDAFMPPSRRESSNQYCGSVSRFARELTRVGSFTRVDHVLRCQNGRYLKVNLECYSRQRTIEFRQHSGTCNASKIENWLRFLLYFVEATRESVAAGSGTGVPLAAGSVTAPRRGRRNVRRNSMERKLDRVLAGLREAGRMGLTVSDIATLGGWAQASVPVYISRIRSERTATIRKDRRTGRYRLVSGGYMSDESVTTTTPVETRRAARGVTLRADDRLFRGIPGEIAGFYAERTAEMAEAAGRR